MPKESIRFVPDTISGRRSRGRWHHRRSLREKAEKGLGSLYDALGLVGAKGLVVEW